MTGTSAGSKLKVTLVTAFASIMVAAIGAVAGATAAPRVAPGPSRDEVRQIVNDESPYSHDSRLILSSLNRQEKQLNHLEDEITDIRIQLARRRVR